MKKTVLKLITYNYDYNTSGSNNSYSDNDTYIAQKTLSFFLCLFCVRVCLCFFAYSLFVFTVSVLLQFLCFYSLSVFIVNLFLQSQFFLQLICFYSLCVCLFVCLVFQCFCIFWVSLLLIGPSMGLIWRVPLWSREKCLLMIVLSKSRKFCVLRMLTQIFFI